MEAEYVCNYGNNCSRKSDEQKRFYRNVMARVEITKEGVEKPETFKVNVLSVMCFYCGGVAVLAEKKVLE